MVTITGAHGWLRDVLCDPRSHPADVQLAATALHGAALQQAEERGWDDCSRFAVCAAALEVRAWVMKLTLLPAEDAGRPQLQELVRTAARRVLVLAELADGLCAPRAGTPACAGGMT